MLHQKCTFCIDVVDAGIAKGLTPGVDPAATPACVNSCISGALTFGDIEDPESPASKTAGEVGAFPHARGPRDRSELLLHLGQETGGPDVTIPHSDHNSPQLDGRSPQLAEKSSQPDKKSHQMDNTHPRRNRMKGDMRVMGPWPRLQKYWDVRAACNFIGGGTGTGLLMLAAVCALLGQPSYASIIAGVLSVSFGLFMVFLEIGRPWRSLNMFFHPKTSWMTREGIVAIPMYLSAALAFFYLEQTFGTWAMFLTGLLAAAYLYCQMRMLNAALGIPAWCHPRLKPYMLISGPTEGVGIAVCLPGLMTEEGVWLVLGLLLLARYVAWNGYARGLHRDGVPQASCAEIDRQRTSVLIGHALAWGLLVVAWLSGVALFAALAGLLAAATGWLTKFVIVTRAAQTRGFAIPRTPVRGQGQSHTLNRQGQGW